MAEGVKREQKRGTRAVVGWVQLCKGEKIWRTKNEKNPDVTSEQLEDVVNQNFGFISFGHK